MPSAVTSSTASTWLEMFPKRSPVPCVAVEIAPDTVCTSMSPRFSSARPSAASRSLRSRITMPPSTFASPASRSMSSTRFMRSIRIIVPSVQAMSVNE